MTTKVKIIVGFLLMVAIQAGLATLGYVDLHETNLGVDEYKRLSILNAATSDLNNDLNRSMAFMYKFLGSKDGADVTVARDALKAALAEVATCYEQTRLQERKDISQKIKSSIEAADKLEIEIMGSLSKAAEQYSKTVVPQTHSMNKQLVAMAAKAHELNDPDASLAVSVALSELGTVRSAISRYAGSRFDADRKRVRETMDGLFGKVRELERILLSEAGKKDYAALLEAYTSLDKSFVEMNGLFDIANKNIIELNALLTNSTNASDTLSDAVDKQANTLVDSLQVDSKDAQKHLLLVGIIGSILGVLCAVFIIRGIVLVLNKLSLFAGQVSRGNFSAVADVKEKGEIGVMVASLEAIPAVLKEVISAYSILERNVEMGQLDTQSDASKFSGEFSSLVQGTNKILSRYRAVLDSLPSPVVTMDGQFRIVYVNAVARRLAGENYVGKTCGEVFKPEDYGTPADAIRQAASTLKPAKAETRAHPAGLHLEVAYNCIPMLDANGRLAYLLQLVTDITELKRTQHTIMEVATQAMDISNRVAAASEQLSSQVEQVSRGTDVQRDRAASTATAMEEMNATVLEVAKNAGQASEQAEATRSKAQYGADVVDKVIAAIRQVNNVANELQANMQELGAQAESIGGVMNVISDIADQTNLLALNAAIEAARAGEAGRGFAVVADEVRKLAEKTMGATTEVGSSIRGIQASATNNISRVGAAAKSVTEATDLAGTSGAALQEILKLAANNSALIAGIATAAEEQSSTSEEINRSVEEVNRIAGETAAGMGQSASAVQELSHMAQELKVLLDKLRG